MSIGSLYSLADAQEATGVPRSLVTYLIKDRGIPVRHVGMAKVIDDDGLSQLRKAIAEYQTKSEVRATA